MQTCKVFKVQPVEGLLFLGHFKLKEPIKRDVSRIAHVSLAACIDTQYPDWKFDTGSLTASQCF